MKLPLIGPAAALTPTLRRLCAADDRPAILLHGPSGSGKTDLLNRLALELTGGEDSAIEMVNGQSLDIARVREWRDRACLGNLFSRWTVKRVDEFDSASPAARNEILTLLDTLPAHHAILVSTNHYESIRSDGGRRLESRFSTYSVNGPSPEAAAQYLSTHLGIPGAIAAAIAEGSQPDGELALDLGVNMRLCLKSAKAWLATQPLELAA